MIVLSRFSVTMALFLGRNVIPSFGGGLQLRSRNDLERRLQLDGRHPNDVPHVDVDSSNSYPGGQIFNSISDTTCQPDGSGYFGSVEGPKYVVRYGFGVEATPRADESEILQAVQKAIGDVLLSTYLPTICTENVFAETTGITGFRFNTDEDPQIDTCTPLVHPSASCKVYEGVVEVHGTEKDILGTITRHLGHENTRTIHESILRLFPVTVPSIQNVKGETPTTTNSSGSDGLSSGAIVGIVFSTLTLVIGIVGFIIFERKRRKEDFNEICTVSPHSYDHQFSPYLETNEAGAQVEESVVLEGGQTVLLGDSGRPKAMFRSAPNSEDQVSLMESDMSSSMFHSGHRSRDYDV